MTPHETTPTLAPARVERWAIIDVFDCVSVIGSEQEARLFAEEEDRHSRRRAPHRVARVVELRPGDVFLPSEAREGAVEAMEKLLHEHQGPMVPWEQVSSWRREWYVLLGGKLFAALAALARPSGEEGR